MVSFTYCPISVLFHVVSAACCLHGYCLCDCFALKVDTKSFLVNLENSIVGLNVLLLRPKWINQNSSLNLSPKQFFFGSDSPYFPVYLH